MNQDDLKNYLGHFLAWGSAVIGGLSFEMWVTLIGLSISAFISYTNWQSTKLRNRLIEEESNRSEELHALEVMRIKSGLPISPAVVHEPVRDMANKKVVNPNYWGEKP